MPAQIWGGLRTTLNTQIESMPFSNSFLSIIYFVLSDFQGSSLLLFWVKSQGFTLPMFLPGFNTACSTYTACLGGGWDSVSLTALCVEQGKLTGTAWLLLWEEGAGDKWHWILLDSLRLGAFLRGGLPRCHPTGCTPVVEEGKDTALCWPSLGVGCGKSTRLLQLGRKEEGRCFLVGVHLEERGSMKRIVSQILCSFP